LCLVLFLMLVSCPVPDACVLSCLAACPVPEACVLSCPLTLLLILVLMLVISCSF